jgi:hypothetical protein
MPPKEMNYPDTDPHACHNLATPVDPGHREGLRQLRGLLERWIDDHSRVFERRGRRGPEGPPGRAPTLTPGTRPRPHRPG